MSNSVSHNLLQSKINSSGIPANTLLRPKCVHQVPAQPRKSSLSKKFCGNSLQKPKLAMGSRRPVTFVPCAVLTTDQPSDQLAGKYNLDGNIELQVYVDASSPGSTKVDIQVSYSGDSLVLHWGGIQDRKEKWVLPSRHPDGTKVYKNKALRTPFAKSGSNSSLKIEIDDPAIQAIEFLIVDESQNRWFKNNGGNFHVKLPFKERSISNVSVPEDLVQVQAYLRWERKGKQMYTPEQEKVEYEAARTELLEEVARGASIQELQARLTKKSDSGNSHEQSQAGNKEVSKAAKKHESKQVYRTGRINRKQRDLMKILNKHTTKPVDEAKLANEESAKPKALKAVELFAKEKEEQDGASTLNKQIYKLGDKDLLVLVTKVADKIRVHLATDIKEPVNLHWALSVNRAGEWLEPPPNVLPQGSVSLNGAVETQFVSSSVDSTYEIQSLEIETQEKSFKGMPFVLCSSGNWIKNQGSDFYADFGVAVKKVQKDAGDGKGTAKALLDNIADLESEAQKSFMHRFNIAADLMSQAKDAGALGLAGILVWMRFMATRQLIWNKNYNVKPREISKAQDRLTDLLQSIYTSYPQHRELLRMILSTVGRGGEGDVGQRIRDEILVIQRNCDCKGGMMEEWHQKLHNNTSPDDVVICQALIDYIKSDFDIGVYWKTLNDNGITKERLLSYDRAIHNEPRFRADQKDRLLHDLGNYMRTLKAVHSGADLESAITNCLGYSAEGQGFMVGVQINPVSGLPSEVPGLLQFVMEHVEDRNVEVLVEGLLEARQEIWPLLSKPNDRLKDLLFLDIALDSTVRTAIERGYEELNNSGPEKIMYFISMVLENLALSSDDNEDLLYCLKGWNQALNMLKNNADHWALFAKSILDRTRLALANKAESYHSILPPSAEYLGSKLGVDESALSIFTEEVIRAGSAASLSALVNRLDPVLRKTANLGSWQVISPVEVVGYVVVVDELLTVQNKVYDKPTILVARSVRGEEEIPDGTVAVLTPDMPDVLSHVSVRARNSKVCFATCFDSNILADLQACEGKLLRVKPTSADVVYSEVNESELGDASSTNLNEDTPALTLVKKQFTGRYAISSDEFTSEMVGAKSRNISYIKGKLPSWVGIPTSVALPFGVFEKVLSEDSNKAVADKIETLKKKLKEGDFGSLGEIRETVLQLTAPPPLVQELKSKMQSSGMPWPGDEGEPDALGELLVAAGCVTDFDECRSVCSTLAEKFGKHGLVKAKPTVRSLAAPVRMDDGMDEGQAPKKKQEAIDGPVLTERDRAKLDRRKRKDERQREQQYQMHLAEMEAARAGMPVVTVNHDGGGGANIKDLHLEGFNVSVGGRDLIVDGSVTLTFGRHYGLIGRNGTGKTTFLRHLAMHAIDGIPNSCQILHVEQEVAGDDTSALQCVVNTDIERSQLLEEEVRLLAQQRELELEEAMGKSNEEIDKDAIGLRLQEVYKRLEFIDADSAESRAASILAGLSFSPEMQQKATKTFSGGWRMRIALARALFIEPDLLLLDEPTNHLDLHAVLWLESYLVKWPKTCIIVSHAREFLNSVVTDILHLHGQKLTAYKGDYDTYERTRIEQLKNQQKAFESNERSRNHMQAFIDKFRYNAKRAALVQSRIKALDRLGHVDEIVNDPDYKFEFPTPDDRPGAPIISFSDASFGYPGGPLLFKNLNFGIDLDSRIAMVGPNGIGKSTILKLIAGELQPTSGTVFRSAKVRIAVFSQHHVDGLDLTSNPLLYMMRCFPGVPEQKLRSHLGSFGVTGNLALQPMYTLSGGQKSRVAFAKITFKKPHIILLDEPSNHLDLDAVEALIQGLVIFQGGILMVSHDEHLISGSVDELWVVSEGKIAPFHGTFQDYKKLLQSH